MAMTAHMTEEKKLTIENGREKYKSGAKQGLGSLLIKASGR